MPASAVALVLLAAVLHASWNAVVRISDDRLLAVLLINVFGGAAALLLLPFAALPAVAAWPYLLTSTALHVGYNSFLAAAYGHGGLGQIYPIARGSAPLLVLILAWATLDETVSRAQLLGILVTSGGIAALAFRGPSAARVRPIGLFFAFGTAAFIAAYTVVDAAGARRAGTPHGYALVLFVLDGTACAAYAFWRRGLAPVLAIVHRTGGQLVLGGLMSLLAYWLVIWALTLAPAGPVAALRETSVVIAALLGTLLLKEPLGGWRVTAAAVVAVGAILLRY